MVRLCALALVLMTLDGACAQSWPSRPIRAIVPYTAGGAIDIVSRTVAQQLSLQLGYPIVIESRPGAGGVIGTAAVAKADPDGHTILLTASSHTISPWAYSICPMTRWATSPGLRRLPICPTCLWSARGDPIGAGARCRRTVKPGGSTTHRAEAAADPPQCRAVSPQRRVRRRARSIQGRTRRWPK